MGLYLNPADIRYTQETIGTVFRRNTKHKNTQIGKALDELLVASSSIEKIPKITVFQKKGQWYSFDNRRLWIFKKLEEYGKCSKILVKKSKRFQFMKFTTKNDGMTVKLRGGDPGGTYWRQQEELVKSHRSDQHYITSTTIQVSATHECKEPTAELHNESKDTKTNRTTSSAPLTKRPVNGDKAENLNDLNTNTSSSKPSSAVLDLYFSVMLDSSTTSNRNGLDKSGTKSKMPETPNCSDSTFNDSQDNETQTSTVSDDGSDSTLHDSYNSPEMFDDEPDSTLQYSDISPEMLDDNPDSTLLDSYKSPEMSDDDPDSTLHDSYNSPEMFDDDPDSTLHDSYNSHEMSDDDPDSTLHDSENDVTVTSSVLPEIYDGDLDSTLTNSDNAICGTLTGVPDDVSDSTLTDSDNAICGTLTVVPDDVSDSTLTDSDNAICSTLTVVPDNVSDSTLTDSKNAICGMPTVVPDDVSDSTLTDSKNVICSTLTVVPDDVSDSTLTLKLSQEMCVCDSKSTLYSSYSQETLFTDTTPMSPILTEMITDMNLHTDLLGLRFANLGLRLLSTGNSTSTASLAPENQIPTCALHGKKVNQGKKKKRKKIKK